MIEIISLQIKPTVTRLGIVVVRYYDIELSCDLCIYKDQKLWVRMPEIWINERTKRRFAWWFNAEKSHEFQKTVLAKIFTLKGITLESAIKLKKEVFEKRKQVTLKNKQFTLSKKNSKV